jgi:hypothetical protein
MGVQKQVLLSVWQPSPLLIGVQDIVAGLMSAYFGVVFDLTPERIA